MQFVKMQGIGNDFIVVNAIESPLEESRLEAISKQINDRKFGIGGDGLVLVLPSKTAQFKMRMFNPDGSEAEMCGNGIRCFAKYVFDRKLHTDTNLSVETLAGVKTLKLYAKSGKVEWVRVDMGSPRLKRSEIPMRGEEAERVVAEALKVDGQKFDITAVSMGNPHAIIFEDKLEAIPLAKWGSQVENHKAFPQRTNVHFVNVRNVGEVEMRTWERGAGETLACGTGACAVAVACVLNGKTNRDVELHLPGGNLRVEWTGDNRVLMTGPAEEVFTGEIALP